MTSYDTHVPLASQANAPSPYASSVQTETLYLPPARAEPSSGDVVELGRVSVSDSWTRVLAWLQLLSLVTSAALLFASMGLAWYEGYDGPNIWRCYFVKTELNGERYKSWFEELGQLYLGVLVALTCLMSIYNCSWAISRLRNSVNSWYKSNCNLFVILCSYLVLIVSFVVTRLLVRSKCHWSHYRRYV